jgi:hypothetical protein
MADTTVASLLRGTGGFSPNYLSESLNPFIHTGGPRRGRSPPPSPVALMAWIMERGDDVVRVRLRL